MINKLDLTQKLERNWSIEDVIRAGRSSEIDLVKLAGGLKKIQDKVNEIIDVLNHS